MFKVEFKRIFLSLPTLLFYVSILALALLSFFFSTQDRAAYAEVLSGGYVDIDTQKMEALIENYRGYKFAENFFFGDFGDLTTVVILLFIGIFLAPVMQNLQKSGLGNLIMVRTHYVDYLQLKIKVLLAYVASILFISFLSVTILAYVIGGYQGLADIGTGYLSFGQQMLSWLGQWLILILFFCLLAVISMLMSVVIENRYLLQLFPVIAYLLVPIFISSTLGNLFYGVGVLMEGFISWNYQRIMYGLLHTAAGNGGSSLGFLFPYMIAFVFFVLCVVVLYRANVKRFRTDYL